MEIQRVSTITFAWGINERRVNLGSLLQVTENQCSYPTPIFETSMLERKACMKTAAALIIIVSIVCYSSVVHKLHLFKVVKLRRNPAYDYDIAANQQSVRMLNVVCNVVNDGFSDRFLMFHSDLQKFRAGVHSFKVCCLHQNA